MPARPKSGDPGLRFEQTFSEACAASEQDFEGVEVGQPRNQVRAHGERPSILGPAYGKPRRLRAKVSCHFGTFRNVLKTPAFSATFILSQASDTQPKLAHEKSRHHTFARPQSSPQYAKRADASKEADQADHRQHSAVWLDIPDPCRRERDDPCRARSLPGGARAWIAQGPGNDPCGPERDREARVGAGRQ